MESTDVLETGGYDPAVAATADGWDAELAGGYIPETEEYGISSLTYTAHGRPPFHPLHLADALAGLRRLLRSKGFCSIPRSPRSGRRPGRTSPSNPRPGGRRHRVSRRCAIDQIGSPAKLSTRALARALSDYDCPSLVAVSAIALRECGPGHRPLEPSWREHRHLVARPIARTSMRTIFSPPRGCGGRWEPVVLKARNYVLVFRSIGAGQGPVPRLRIRLWQPKLDR